MRRLFLLLLLLVPVFLVACGNTDTHKLKAPVSHGTPRLKSWGKHTVETTIKLPNRPGVDPVVGQILTSSTGTWGNSPVSYQYQWLRCDTGGSNCSNITSLSVSNTYTIVSADVGHTIRSFVVASNPAGSANQTSDQTTVVTGGTPSFVAGTCSPACTAPADFTGKTMANVPDSSPAPYCGSLCGTGSPNVASRNYAIARPNNLTSAPAPLVLLFNDTQSSPAHAQWLAAAGQYGFVVAEAIQFNPHCSSYETASYNRLPVCMGCGTNANAQCDDTPFFQSIIGSMECPYVSGGSSSTCQGINPNEVYVEGGSNGASTATGMICDTRTSPYIHGAELTSIFIRSSAAGTFSNSADAPDCPALLGPSPSCVFDCISSLNHDMSLMWVWGTNDNTLTNSGSGGCNWVSPQGYSSLGNNCVGNGYKQSNNIWAFGNKYEAQTMFGQQALGCSTTPVSTTTSGLANNTLTTTYSNCANATHPSLAATRDVQISYASHLPEGPPCQAGATEAACQFGDGISTPSAAYQFWSTYPAF